MIAIFCVIEWCNQKVKSLITIASFRCQIDAFLMHYAINGMQFQLMSLFQRGRFIMITVHPHDIKKYGHAFLIFFLISKNYSFAMWLALNVMTFEFLKEIFLEKIFSLPKQDRGRFFTFSCLLMLDHKVPKVLEIKTLMSVDTIYF